MNDKIIIKQVKSKIGRKPKQRATLRALGLRSLGAERVHNDTTVIRGMIARVQHLIEVRKYCDKGN